MKCITLILVALAMAFNLYSQKKAAESFYFFDSTMNGVQAAADAVYFGKLSQLSDTCWQWDLYTFFGPRIKRIQYRDGQMESTHGKLLYYNKTGYFDSTGYAYDNLRHGDWYYYNDTGKAVLRKIYEMGHLTSTTNIDTVSKDSDTTDGVESSFVGGFKKWKQYLMKTMEYPQRAQNALITGSVVVAFMVNTEGKAVDAEIHKSVEYSLDEEAIRLIVNSPKWTPGQQFGRLVKTYKKQPFYFRLQ